MSFKKIFLCGVVASAAFSMISAMADDDFLPNPELMFAVQKSAQKSAEKQTYKNNIYIEGNAGYARQNYFSNENYQSFSQAGFGFGINYNNNNNATGGFSGGIDAGYQFDKYFAVEFGWYYLPSVNVMQTGAAPAYLTSWAMYLAAKYLMPLYWMHNTDAFFKLGAEYREATLPAASLVNNVGGFDVSDGNSTFIRPMFATGFDYHFNNEFFGIAQYAYFMGANNSFQQLTSGTGSLGTVGANVFTLGLGYQFDV
ncbi:MAG TPA: hypothetical protein VJK30_00640 [Coxiellaceae bacterium]|nr:MAG: hypothetical protein A3E81_08085 [Gammaproteobacteria bacterium RIFCSPHIGHO2_12_FULL_36_30]HLB55824.1 hypothetical protein [Coxiellaceae bacterium]